METEPDFVLAARLVVDRVRDPAINQDDTLTWLSGLLAIAGHRMERIDDFLRKCRARLN
jgi:hypothetical protein